MKIPFPDHFRLSKRSERVKAQKFEFLACEKMYKDETQQRTSRSLTATPTRHRIPFMEWTLLHFLSNGSNISTADSEAPADDPPGTIS